MEGGHFSEALTCPSWRGGPGTPQSRCISLCSWAESVVLDEGPSARVFGGITMVRCFKQPSRLPLSVQGRDPGPTNPRYRIQDCAC